MRSRNLSYDRCINLMPVMLDRPQGKEVGMLIGTPGLNLLATVGAGPIRGGWRYKNYAYVVSGNGLYQINTQWAAILLGALSTNNGYVSFCNNTTQLLVSDGVYGYLYVFDTGEFSTVTSFPQNAQLLSYQDGFGITNIFGTQQFYQSNENDLGIWDGLNFASADAQPDDIIAIVDVSREVWLLGSRSTEVWINAGLPNFVFQRLTGVMPEFGCVAPFSAVRVGESVMFMSQDEKGQGFAVQTRGYNLINVTDEATGYVFSEHAREDGLTDCFAFSYQQERHIFYCVTFPKGNMTWVYDVVSKRWHQRASFTNGVLGRHIASCHFFYNNRNVVGDYRNGNIYDLDLNTYTDNEQPRKWVRGWRALPPEKQSFEPITFNSLQIDAQTGINVPDGTSPSVMLRWSDDGGHRWSSQRNAKFGDPGETGRRVMFRRLGSTKVGRGLDRVFELSGTDPVPIAFTGADMDAEQA